MVKKFDKCDFSEIKEWVDMDRKLKKAATADEKLAKKVHPPPSLMRTRIIILILIRILIHFHFLRACAYSPPSYPKSPPAAL